MDGDKKQYMVVSFPRQGTDFFMNCLVKNNSNLFYYREFFSPICTPIEYVSWIRTAFGAENRIDKIFFNNEKVLEKVYKETWCKTNFNITKEVFSFAKVSFYQKHFELLALFRHRRNTFPTTRPWFIMPIYDSFMRSNIEFTGVREVKEYFNSLKINDILKQTLIHTLCWYLQFHQIQNSNTKILRYGYLINMQKEELDLYLKNNMPVSLYNKNIADNIIKSRNKDIKKESNERYKKYRGVEGACLKLIELLKSFNTGLREEYWGMLY